MLRYFAFLCFCGVINSQVIPFNGCCSRNAIVQPTIASGNAVTTVTALPLNGCNPPVSTSQVTPLFTEIIPSLQFGDITVGGDIPIGGSIKVQGCIPVYGVVSVDGVVPSAGTALINAGGGLVTQVLEPGCRLY